MVLRIAHRRNAAAILMLVLACLSQTPVALADDLPPEASDAEATLHEGLPCVRMDLTKTPPEVDVGLDCWQP